MADTESPSAASDLAAYPEPLLAFRTRIGADFIRGEANDSLKYVGGIFAGGLYSRSDTRTYTSAKSRATAIQSAPTELSIQAAALMTDSSWIPGCSSVVTTTRSGATVLKDSNYKPHVWVWSVESGYTIPLGQSGTKDVNKIFWALQPQA